MSRTPLEAWSLALPVGQDDPAADDDRAVPVPGPDRQRRELAPGFGRAHDQPPLHLVVDVEQPAGDDRAGSRRSVLPDDVEATAASR